MIGRTISHYRIVSQLGSGGMGVVYGAEDIRLGREVAVKFVSEDFAHDAQALERLRSEARAASALNHGNICTIYDVGEDNGHPFIVMELMKGQTLRDRLESGPLKVTQLVDIGIAIADALHSTHSDGIIHRDIKPGNIFLTDRGHVKILDFGLAKLTPHFSRSKTTNHTLQKTVAGLTLGTISYMSPEQAEGEELDGRSDLFSLGAVLYECATGHHPFPAKTSAATLAAILNKVPVAPIVLNTELPLRLQEVINNCLEKDRELRYQSAAELRADLKRLRRDLDAVHGRSGPVPSTWSAASNPAAQPVSDATIALDPATHTTQPAAASASTSRPRAPWIAAGLVTAVVITLASYALWLRDTARPREAASAVAPADNATQSRLELARASLNARNYRAAAAYAAEVLALNAAHPEAASIRDASRAMLERFDAAMAAAQNLLAIGDVQGAAQALDTARAIDATAPAIVEMSSRLADEVRRRDTRAQATAPLAPPRETPTAAARTPTTTPAAATKQGTAPVPPSVPVAVAPTEVPPITAPPSVPTTAPPAPAVAVTPEPPDRRPTPATSTVPERRENEAPSPPAATTDQDDAAIRRLTSTYARAIETKDLALFRSIKPNLSRDEERRLAGRVPRGHVPARQRHRGVNRSSRRRGRRRHQTPRHDSGWRQTAVCGKPADLASGSNS